MIRFIQDIYLFEIFLNHLNNFIFNTKRLVRITASNDNHRSRKFRYITVE